MKPSVNEMRSFALVAVAAIMFAGRPVPIRAQANCSTCIPSRDTSIIVSGTLTVCFADTAAPSGGAWGGEEVDIQTGIERYWEDWYSENQVPIDFDFTQVSDETNCPSGSVVMKKGNPGSSTAYAGAFPTSNGQGASVVYSPSQTSGLSEDDWKALGAHEMGHILGYQNIDTPSGCDNYSIMANTGPLYWPGDSSGPMCGEIGAFSGTYSTGGDTDYRNPTGSDCEDGLEVWHIRITWCNYGNGWFVCGWSETFLGCHYGPLPEG